jgi:hypothetical protein
MESLLRRKEQLFKGRPATARANVRATRLGKVATEALAIRITVLLLTLIGNSASRVNTILIEEQQRTEEGSSSRKTIERQT